jgi:hypothetical protein
MVIARELGVLQNRDGLPNGGSVLKNDDRASVISDQLKAHTDNG